MLQYNRTKEDKIRADVITLAMKEEELRRAYSNISVKEKKQKLENKTSKKGKNKKEKVKKEKKIKKFSLKKILLFLFLILLFLIAIDIVSVTKFDKGPFFAIPNKKINNGNEEYYGLGYKVTKYSKKIGKKQRKIEFWWNLIKLPKLSQKKIQIKDRNLLKEILKDEKKTYNKYKNKTLKIDSKLSEIDPENHQIIAKHKDEDKKTDLLIICKMNNKDQNKLNKLKAEKDIKITGNIKNIKTKVKDDRRNVNVYLKNCSPKQ